MAINHTTRNNPKKTEDNKQGLGMKVIYFALNFILVPFSAYQTYIGYEKFLGSESLSFSIPAAAIAAVSALIFFGLNYTIMERRVTGKPHLTHIFGYLLPLAISFFGNFNSIYSAQMKGKLVSDELAVYSTNLNTTYNSALSEIDKSTGLSDLKINLDSELSLLKLQMEDQGAYNGYGKEAKIKWGEINKLFENYNKQFLNGGSGKLTKIYNTSRYKNFENTANQYYNSLEKSKLAEVNKVLEPIKAKYKEVTGQYDKMIKEDEAKSSGFQMLEDIRKINNEVIGNPVNSYLSNLNNNSNFSYTELKESDQRQLGTIKHSLESAYVKWENPVATFFSTFFSLVIDLIPLGFLFLVFPYNSNKRKNKPTGPRSL
jgi:hypothetical protein